MLIKLDELSPYVIHYYAMEEDSLFVYLALELCDRTLEEQVRVWKESIQVSSSCYIPILRQIICGLMDLHRCGVVHRDLKPPNILVMEPKEYSVNNRLPIEHYRIKIADVGLAKRMSTETTLAYMTNGNSTSNKAEGSYGWRAAEVLNKEKQNTSLDIFAAGCILYFVLTGGKHPFGNSVYERESKICKGDYNLAELENLQLWDAKDLIEKMIGLDPSSRLSAKQILKHPFFWSDTKKLSFLSDVSDRLSFFKNGNGSRENKDLIVSFEKYCRIVLATTETKRISWATKIDMIVLKAPNSRNYDTTSVSDLLRLIRNKRSHYNELPSSVQRVLGLLPCYDREENFNHNFWQYFNSRFPKLLITVYTFVIQRSEFLQDKHFQGYGMSQREWIRNDEEEDKPDKSTIRYQSESTKMRITDKKERKQYSIEMLQQLKQGNWLPRNYSS
ncbi:Serine/threonine-protein kinase/endoribonuclease IRE1 [Galdieria sulphuraria]|nr:Serine/threonine-protein kinase/endoribonuclease IRE1 [Galdieria sulphuraria]